jgi:hypothetical protein
LDLHVPDTTLLHVALDRRTVLADRTEVARVLIYVVAPNGSANREELPLAEVSRGGVSLQPREAGVWEGNWSIPPGAAGEERLTVRLLGLPASRAVVRLLAQAGPPAVVGLALDRAFLVAGETEDVQATVRTSDSVGNPCPARLALSTDFGSLTPPEEASPGTYKARLRVTPSFGGRPRLQVTARALSTAATASVPLLLAPAPATRAVLAKDRDFYLADGRSELELDLRAWDAFDNPAEGLPKLGASQGVITRIEPLGSGHWAVRYRPAPVEWPLRGRITAELANARADEELELMPPSDRRIALLGGGGLVAGGVVGGHITLGLERPMSFDPLSSSALKGAWRLELGGLAGSRNHAGGQERLRVAALMAGPEAVSTTPNARWSASGTAGLLIGSTLPSRGSQRLGAGLAGRLTVGVAVPRRRLSPFLEVGLLGASGLPGGGFVSFQLSLGVRFDTIRAAPAPDEGE